MEHTIRIHQAENSQILSVQRDSILLSGLQSFGLSVSAPCGGKGTCGKCKVEVRLQEQNHSVLSCQYRVSSDLEVYLPKPQEIRILSESYFPELNLEYKKVDQASYGIAVDVGTTTVVVFLEDLQARRNLGSRSFLNPQKAYGADVISRIQYGSDPEHLVMLQKVLLTELNVCIEDLAHEFQLDAGLITAISIAGNTTMLHLLKGVDPSSLAVYPFTPVFLEQQSFPAIVLGLSSIPEATVYLLPSLSAYVGADILAGIAASELPDEENWSLFLDIGTNGEMALGNRQKILCCATAAGPAFEGAKISCGLGGVQGAIHRFTTEGYETIGNSKPIGLCGSGLIDVVSVLLQTQKLDPSGYLEKAIHFIDESGLSLSPQDIREVQLAKGAIAAGIETLIKKAGIETRQIAKVYLAGGFGYAIHPESASALGLFPKELEDKIIRAGNTAGLGARLFLHSDEFAARIKNIADRAEHFDLSMDMGFNESFVMNMGFPDHSVEEQ